MKRAADYCFKVADWADKCGWAAFILCLGHQAFWRFMKTRQTDEYCHPILIIAAALAILVTVITTIYQTEGNRALRSTQLSNALGAGIGEPIRDDYYNNALPQSLLSLLRQHWKTRSLQKQFCQKWR